VNLYQNLYWNLWPGRLQTLDYAYIVSRMPLHHDQAHGHKGDLVITRDKGRSSEAQTLQSVAIEADQRR
jgi:hypothetical protein